MVCGTWKPCVWDLWRWLHGGGGGRDLSLSLSLFLSLSLSIYRYIEISLSLSLSLCIYIYMYMYTYVLCEKKVQGSWVSLGMWRCAPPIGGLETSALGNRASVGGAGKGERISTLFGFRV